MSKGNSNQEDRADTNSQASTAVTVSHKRSTYAGRSREQFLEDLSKLAATATRFDEAAGTLGLEVEELKQLLHEDVDVAKAWNEPRLALVLTIKRALLEKAHSGSVTAIKAVQKSLDADDDHAGVDPAHLSGTYLASLVGVSPKTLWVWTTQRGLNKNPDGSFDLAKFLPWYRDHIAATASNGTSPKGDALREEKAKMIRLKLAQQRGELLPRDEVMRGLAARVQALLGVQRDQGALLPEKLVNKSAAEIEVILREYCDAQCQAYLNLPSELWLEEPLATEFRNLLDRLKEPD